MSFNEKSAGDIAKVGFYAYLADVLRRLPTHPNRQLDELLPHVWQPPQ